MFKNKELQGQRSRQVHLSRWTDSGLAGLAVKWGPGQWGIHDWAVGTWPVTRTEPHFTPTFHEYFRAAAALFYKLDFSSYSTWHCVRCWCTWPNRGVRVLLPAHCPPSPGPYLHLLAGFWAGLPASTSPQLLPILYSDAMVVFLVTF